MKKPFNLFNWIEENKALLKPPVGNIQVYNENDDFIVMVVGGPNKRKDYHFNEGEELFFQLKGDINLRIIEDGEPKNIQIKEGDLFLLPSKVPHCPQRPEKTIGLVIERYRTKEEKDRFQWYCETCNHLIYEEYFQLEDIVKQLPEVMNDFYSSKEKRTCSSCGTVMEPPK